MNEDTLYFDVDRKVKYQLKTLQNSKNIAVLDSSLQSDRRGFTINHISLIMFTHTTYFWNVSHEGRQYIHISLNISFFLLVCHRKPSTCAKKDYLTYHINHYQSSESNLFRIINKYK